MLLVMCLCAGCVGKKKEKNSYDGAGEGTVVFTFGGQEIKKGEVYIYINTIKERYELQYGSKVWDTSINTEDGEQNLEEVTREAVIAEIVKVKTLIAHAEEQNVTLSDEEKEQIAQKTAEFYEGLTDSDLTEMELDEAIINRVFTENRLAELVQEQILVDHPIEISDEEARMTRFYDLYFPAFHFGGDGNVTPLSEEEKAQQYEKASQACGMLATVDSGESEITGIRDLANYFNLTKSGEQVMSPEEIRETYGTEIYNYLYEMENGQFSVVMESEYGYHVFQMIALTDRESTDAKKSTMRTEQMDTLLKDTMQAWQLMMDDKFKYPDSVNMEVYDSIPIRQEAEEESE